MRARRRLLAVHGQGIRRRGTVRGDGHGEDDQHRHDPGQHRRRRVDVGGVPVEAAEVPGAGHRPQQQEPGRAEQRADRRDEPGLGRGDQLCLPTGGAEEAQRGEAPVRGAGGHPGTRAEQHGEGQQQERREDDRHGEDRRPQLHRRSGAGPESGDDVTVGQFGRVDADPGAQLVGGDEACRPDRADDPLREPGARPLVGADKLGERGRDHGLVPPRSAATPGGSGAPPVPVTAAAILTSRRPPMPSWTSAMRSPPLLPANSCSGLRCSYRSCWASTTPGAASAPSSRTAPIAAPEASSAIHVQARRPPPRVSRSPRRSHGFMTARRGGRRWRGGRRGGRRCGRRTRRRVPHG